METQGNLIATNNSTQSVTVKKDDDQFTILPKARLHRRFFSNDFLFGTASSAYQFEGAAHEGGRGPSIWDTFTQRYPAAGKVKDGGNGNVAVDSYHLYKA
ncbi:unnamed protein product [Ilex paraguariensis]|uniref:Beta-glucosidase n=1 Tax=Ilex paraguariensis TaxID=185542 RepID=A0ABC8RK61_9AQUA